MNYISEMEDSDSNITHLKGLQRSIVVTPTYHLIVAIIMTILSCGSGIGNGIVIWTVLRFRSLRSTSNLLIANLSVANLLMTVIDFPLLITASFLNYWPFHYSVCQMYGMLTGFAGLVTINSLTGIALYRYFSIIRVRKVSNASIRKTIKVIAFAWTYAFLWAIAPICGWGKYILDSVKTTCTFDYRTRSASNISFILGICIGEFVLPIMGICFSYFKIFAVMILRRQELELFVKTNRTKKDSLKLARLQYKVNSERRTAFIIIGLVTLFVIAWFPYTVAALIGLFGDQDLLTPYVTSLAGLLAKTSTVYNPVVYALVHPKFKQKLKSSLPFMKNDENVIPASNYDRSTTRYNGRSVSDPGEQTATKRQWKMIHR